MAIRWSRIGVAVLLCVPLSSPVQAAPVISVHVLAMVPSGGKGSFSPASLTSGAKAALAFWSSESGGALRFKLLPTRTRTSSALGHCDHPTDKALAIKLFGIRGNAANSIYLVGNAGSTCKKSLGRGELNGAWVTLSRASAGVIAHELGHIFGLLHAGSANCAPPGQFGLSIPDSKCKTEEYGDSDDIMGNNFSADLGEVALSGLTLTTLGYIKPLRAEGTGRWTLGPTETGARPLVVPTSFGDAYVEYSIGHKGTLFGADNDHTVQVRLRPSAKAVAKTNDSLQLWAFRDARVSGDVNGPYLYPGERFRIPGSDMQLAIGAMDRTGADITVSPADAAAPTRPAAPTSARRESGAVTFAAAADVTGFVFYVNTISGPRIVGSLRGNAERWALPGSLTDGAIPIGVATVSADGAVSAIVWAKA